MRNLIASSILLILTIVSVYYYPSVDAYMNQPLVERPVVISVDPVSNIEPIPNHGIIGQQNSNIEVAFVLDTTGSMGGLIQGAKDNIWSIASSMASADSSPTIKMGLVAYRDRGDDYVTRISDLTDDLDTSYGTLMGFQANGGGDTPESVNKALYDAVNSLSWSQDDDTYRVIFLVGDAPPKMNYSDEMQYPDIVKLAKQKGIVINAIQCGSMTHTTQSWQQIASLGDGEFFQVEQSGSAIAVSTPYDEEIASLAKNLDDTRLFYGDKKVLEEKAAKVAAADHFNRSAPAASVARKAEFNVSKSGARNLEGDNELVADISSGKVALEEISEAELPKELRKLGRKEQKMMLAEKARKRDELKERIGKLSAQRNDYLKEQFAETGTDKESLDNKIYQTVRAQAGEKGLVYSDEAAKY